MQVSTFKYTKAKGATSDREVIVLQAATTNMLGIDISELDKGEQCDFIEEFKELKIRQNAETQALMQKHDLKYALKQFKSSGMHDVINEKL
jgi:hypothetical protein